MTVYDITKWQYVVKHAAIFDITDTPTNKCIGTGFNQIKEGKLFSES